MIRFETNKEIISEKKYREFEVNFENYLHDLDNKKEDQFGNLNKYSYIQSVQKGWNTPGDLFGVKNVFLNQFEYKDEFYKKMSSDLYIENKIENWLNLIFDEANLSPIEHYLSDFFSKDDDFKKYLISEKFIETKSKVIMDLTQKSAPKRSKGGILLHSIFNSTIKNLDKYNFANEPKGALGALKLGGGDCTDYTDLFVALCRARGLPARHVHGILASGFSDTPKHSWAEVYIPHNGWVRLDPFLVEAGKASFRRLKNYYITLNHDRNDGIYSKDNGVWYWRYYYWGDPIAISEKLDCGYGVFSESVSSIKGDK